MDGAPKTMALDCDPSSIGWRGWALLQGWPARPFAWVRLAGRRADELATKLLSGATDAQRLPRPWLEAPIAMHARSSGQSSRNNALHESGFGEAYRMTFDAAPLELVP